MIIFCILNWLAALLTHRKFDVSSPIAENAKKFIIDRFCSNLYDIDIIIGYRADDSYFSFAEDFINNTISLRNLNVAIHLGTLGEQIVLVSKRYFEHIQFIGYAMADYHQYYYKRAERVYSARNAYKNRKKNSTTRR
ncbi:MAG: DUF3990 domain-containing protein [Erysipelotrichaceae bacterium]|nr:DUF3990 domain-containing protein [Erysipelotrichaceae bacterium]